MPVTTLELENFKSYGGSQTIGPFKSFTSIIGTNGSGKSNIMDALSFVLGVQSRALRSQQLKDLIHRPPGSEHGPTTLRARACLNFLDDETDIITQYERTISEAGVGEYKINGETVSFKEYEKRLADINVLIKARNFLVFQGDVEALARKTPREFVVLFEQISQSADLREQYEEARLAKEEADAATLYCYNKQKGMKGQRRVLKEQKEEAERFNSLLEQQQKIKTDMFLWILYQMDVDRKESEKKLKELRKDLDENREQEKELLEILQEAKKKASTARRKTQAADKARVDAAAEITKQEPQVIQVNEEIKTLKKHIAQDEKLLESKKKHKAAHALKLEKLEKDTTAAQADLKALEDDYNEIKKGAAPDEVALTAAQEEEYDRVREAAAAASLGPRRNLTNANNQLEAARARAANISDELAELEARRAEVNREVTTLSGRHERIKATAKSMNTEYKDIEKRLKEANSASEKASQRREEIDAEIEDIDAKLIEARNDRRNNRDEEKLLQAIQSLKRHFPGVQGRLVDLCRPTQKRFSAAIQVAAGKDMNAIVVDTKETGIECIRHLREQRVGTATFLPLNSIQVPSVESTESLKAKISRDSRYRLAVDIITCDESVKKAVRYAVGNTVVCDELSAARELCFGGGRRGSGDDIRVKAVTLGGAVISKSGTMTGGVTKDDASRPSRWDERALEKLRERRQELEAERSTLGRAAGDVEGDVSRSSLGFATFIEELRSNLQNIKNRQAYSNSDEGFTSKQLAQKKKLLQGIDKDLPALRDRLEEAENAVAACNEDVTRAIAAVKEAEDEHLAPFRAATGLNDLRAYEEAVGKSRKEFTEKRLVLVEHITHLEQQHEYESNRDVDQPIAKLEKRLKDYNDNLEAALEKHEEELANLEKAQQDLAEAEKAVQEAAAEESSFDEEVQSAQAEYTEFQAVLAKVTKDVTSEETKLERLRGKLHETLQKAQVEEVVLPTLSGSSQPRSSRRSRQVITEDSDSEEEGGSKEKSQDTYTMTQYSQEDNPRNVREREEAAKVDFSDLSADYKRRLNAREESELRKTFEDQIDEVAAQIESMVPNMKAQEALAAITEKLKDSSISYDEAKEAARKANVSFQNVKHERAQRFNHAFNHIDESLKTIYTDMTKSSKHPLGGNAYLSLDDSEEPYNGNITFNSMPPQKRFRDMDQLSGGEKTVAALALLFAIHSYRPAPFFVMDEVDAALDNINLRKVCNYIERRSRSDFQCIVISLKDAFYERSESLVGVCKDVGTNSSRTLTLDLDQYRANDPEEQQRQSRPTTPRSLPADRPVKKTRPSSGSSIRTQ